MIVRVVHHEEVKDVLDWFSTLSEDEKYQLLGKFLGSFDKKCGLDIHCRKIYFSKDRTDLCTVIKLKKQGRGRNG